MLARIFVTFSANMEKEELSSNSNHTRTPVSSTVTADCLQDWMKNLPQQVKFCCFLGGGGGGGGGGKYISIEPFLKFVLSNDNGPKTNLI